MQSSCDIIITLEEGREKAKKKLQFTSWQFSLTRFWCLVARELLGGCKSRWEHFCHIQERKFQSHTQLDCLCLLCAFAVLAIFPSPWLRQWRRHFALNSMLRLFWLPECQRREEMDVADGEWKWKVESQIHCHSSKIHDTLMNVSIPVHCFRSSFTATEVTNYRKTLRYDATKQDENSLKHVLVVLLCWLSHYHSMAPFYPLFDLVWVHVHQSLHFLMVLFSPSILISWFAFDVFIYFSTSQIANIAKTFILIGCKILQGSQQ